MVKTIEHWTIRMIADRVKASGSHYFDAETLRFFGQTIDDFDVYQAGGRVFVFAMAKNGKWAIGDNSGSSFAEFLPKTGKTRSVKHLGLNGSSSGWTEDEVEEFIEDFES